MTERTPAEIDAWLAEVEKLLVTTQGEMRRNSRGSALVDEVPELLRLVRELQAENVRLKDNQDACLMGSRCPMPKGYHDVEEFYRD